MSHTLSRRNFITSTIAGSAAGCVMSVEEHRLLAATLAPAPPAPEPVALSDRWMGQIGPVKISRLICGGNLVSGYAHSRDLIYVSNLLKHYFSDDRIMETWSLCEEHGINTMVAYPGDPHCIEVLQKHARAAERFSTSRRLRRTRRNLNAAVRNAADAGAVGAFLVGNLGDEWSRDGATDRIGEVVELIKAAKLIAGVAGHELRTPQVVEDAGIAVDFYVKTLHDQSYWSKQQPGQDQDIIDNYGIDNYWCKEPNRVIGFHVRGREAVDCLQGSRRRRHPAAPWLQACVPQRRRLRRCRYVRFSGC